MRQRLDIHSAVERNDLGSGGQRVYGWTITSLGTTWQCLASKVYRVAERPTAQAAISESTSPNPWERW